MMSSTEFRAWDSVECFHVGVGGFNPDPVILTLLPMTLALIINAKDMLQKWQKLVKQWYLV